MPCRRGATATPARRRGAASPTPPRFEETARLIADAELPVIVTSNIGRDPKTYAALAALAEAFAIPVVQSVPTRAQSVDRPSDVSRR